MSPLPEPALTALPYDQLSIYYIEGKVRSRSLDLDPAFIGNWEEDGCTFLFFSAPRDEAVDGLLKRRAGATLVDRYAMSYESWLGERFEGFEAGTFSVRPPWNPPPADGSGVRTLLLDPGVVFGTGNHGTTRHCLAAIETLYRRAQPRRVLDLGTGTGILAVAAASLGARRVAAVDLNLLAARTARRNAGLNGFGDRILAVQGRAESLMSVEAELLIANIHYEVMRRLVAEPAFLNIPHFILSGLLRSEAHDIEFRLKGMPVRILERWVSDGIWFTYLGAASQGRPCEAPGPEDLP